MNLGKFKKAEIINEYKNIFVFNSLISKFAVLDFLGIFTVNGFVMCPCQKARLCHFDRRRNPLGLPLVQLLLTERTSKRAPSQKARRKSFRQTE